eukprot:COSAG02_NODE_50377_length_321_cov_0.387387_1_plen_78_part_00
MFDQILPNMPLSSKVKETTEALTDVVSHQAIKATPPDSIFWFDASNTLVPNEAITLCAEQIALVEQTIHPQSPSPQI